MLIIEIKCFPLFLICLQLVLNCQINKVYTLKYFIHLSMLVYLTWSSIKTQVDNLSDAEYVGVNITDTNYPTIPLKEFNISSAETLQKIMQVF